MEALLFSATGTFMKPASIEIFISVFSSPIDPIHFSSSLSSVRHTGNGVPQNLLRLRFQSTIFSSQLPNLPVPVEAGFQLMVLLRAIILSLTAVVLINHASRG